MISDYSYTDQLLILDGILSRFWGALERGATIEIEW